MHGMKSIIHFHKDRSDNSRPIVFLPEVEPVYLAVTCVQNDVVWNSAALGVNLTGVETEGSSDSVAECTASNKGLIMKMA